LAIACAHVFVTGYVQGVFFRHTAAQKARTLGVTGWVKNLPDGRVEVVAEGEQSEVQKLVDWCHSGPPHATVEKVEVEWQPPSDFGGFKIL
jgi:acylphosphatase